jgi:hypothetical protein
MLRFIGCERLDNLDLNLVSDPEWLLAYPGDMLIQTANEPTSR